MEISTINPALKSLEVLVGEWEIELSNASFLPNQSDKVKGHVTFKLLENGGFLIQRQGDIPHSWARWMIGRDDSEQNYCALYFDDRGVSRKYEMSFNDGVWKIWRQMTRFWQRFEGRISHDGKIIKAHWEQSTDEGKNWTNDFDLTYKGIT